MESANHGQSLNGLDSCGGDKHHEVTSNANRSGDGGQDSHITPLIPPYWTHRRYESYRSVDIIKPPPITLEDHTAEQFTEIAPAWAKGITIDDYVLVSGSVPNVGKFVVWNCRIDTLNVRVFLRGPIL